MEISKAQFRMLACTGFFLGVCATIANHVGGSSLPVELQDYLVRYYAASFNLPELVHGVVSLIGIIAYIAIFFFIRWSRGIFTVAYILSCAGVFLLPPIVQPSLATALVELSIFFTGMTVACMYFTPIRRHFEN